MSAIARTNNQAAEVIEKVLVMGNLKDLSPENRVEYYNRVCESLDINPLTRPFEYVEFQGKLTLYARKDLTEQLRAKRDVSLRVTDRVLLDDCYIVTVQALMPSGRCDEATGAVSISGLKGEARANAMMKAETKAKRRATLSICGLGFLDESELDGIGETVRYDQNSGAVRATAIQQNPTPAIAANAVAAAAKASQQVPPPDQPQVTQPSPDTIAQTKQYWAIHGEMRWPCHKDAGKAVNYSVWSKVVGRAIESFTQLDGEEKRKLIDWALDVQEGRKAVPKAFREWADAREAGAVAEPPASWQEYIGPLGLVKSQADALWAEIENTGKDPAQAALVACNRGLRTFEELLAYVSDPFDEEGAQP